ncbi:thiol reductant ABC exporter subunit CydC [Weissella viridescens]|uniref:thiol reductant ABC exporter subunit CydC n=1 Tax=Weissella viridescens TaxID=1629 RepID=UPI001D0916C3|nr:thiol reductant ABC exporter subunit CydC [Weissella viridescens]MCB6840336.1 thiol reductant ABC exporter subunit CydC [Weissella viridescens]MCB6847069.1 thiol reductant ABC exporter subunit CydC [Weissella viridescens]
MSNLWQIIKHDRWVFPYLKRYKGLLTLIIFLGFMTFFCGGALMFTSGYLISRSAQMPENILMVYAPIVLTRAFGIGRPSFRYAERLTSHNWVLRIVSSFRKKLYEIVESGTKSIYAHVQTGEVFNLMANDLFKIENMYLRVIFPSIVGWLLYVLGTLALGIFSPITALIILLVLGIDALVLPLITLSIMGRRDAQQKQVEGRIYTNLTDAVLGLQDWILAGRTTELVNRQEADFNEMGQLQTKDDHFDWWRNWVGEVVIGLATLILIVFATVTFGHTHMGVNWIAAFGLVLFPITDALTSISDGFGELPRYADSIKRLNDMDEKSQAEANAQITQVNIPEKLNIDLQDVTFSYDGKKPVLKNLNLDIPRGQHLAILGQSGAGKSTLLKLILGDETPQSGSVTIGGTPVAALQDHRAELISVLDQQPYLFDTTVSNNLKLGNLHATDAQLWQVLEQVNLKDLVEQLPEKLDTPMTEAGKRFSGGEKQRFALARILLQDTPIVILDEPTVGLDPITELAVLQTIFKTLQDKTLIWVTHHLTGVELVDQVIFIEDAKVTLSGTPEHLMKTSKRFANLLAMDHGK